MKQACLTVQIANELSVGQVKLSSVWKGQKGKDLSGTVEEEAVGALRQESIAFVTHTCSLCRGRSLVPQDTFFFFFSYSIFICPAPVSFLARNPRYFDHIIYLLDLDWSKSWYFFSLECLSNPISPGFRSCPQFW